MASGGCLLMLWADQVLPPHHGFAVPLRGVSVRRDHLASHAIAWTLLDLHRQSVVRLEPTTTVPPRRDGTWPLGATGLQWPPRSGFDGALLRSIAASWDRPVIAELANFVEASTDPGAAVLEALCLEASTEGLAVRNGRHWMWQPEPVAATWPAFCSLHDYWRATAAGSPQLAVDLVGASERALGNCHSMSGMSYGSSSSGGGFDF